MYITVFISTEILGPMAPQNRVLGSHGFSEIDNTKTH